MPADYLWCRSKFIFISDLDSLDSQTNFVNLAVNSLKMTKMIQPFLNNIVTVASATGNDA